MNSGLRRKLHFEEVLAAAVKDQVSQHGLLSVGLQRFATKAINNPLFQRIQETVQNSLELEQKHVMEQRSFEAHVQKKSVEAKVSASDLQYLVNNLQPRQPPPPPHQTPPPPSEARADEIRTNAELDGLLQERARKEGHERMASEVASMQPTITFRPSARAAFDIASASVTLEASV